MARLFLKKDAFITFVSDKKQNVVTYQTYEVSPVLTLVVTPVFTIRHMRQLTYQKHAATHPSAHPFPP